MNQKKLLQVFEVRDCEVTGHDSLLDTRTHRTHTDRHTDTAGQQQGKKKFHNHPIKKNGLVNYMSHFILLATSLKIPTESPVKTEYKPACLPGLIFPHRHLLLESCLRHWHHHLE